MSNPQHNGSAWDENWQWQEDMQDHAIGFYEDHFDVRQASIDDVDDMGSENGLAERLDYSGLDKLVHTDGGDVHMAQRFRRPSRSHERDFSLRKYSTGHQKSEYFKLQEAFQNGYYIPTRYSFGIGCLDGFGGKRFGFSYFCIIDNRRFVQLLSEGVIESKQTNENGSDGKVVEYFDLEKMCEMDVVIREWGDKYDYTEPI